MQWELSDATVLTPGEVLPHSSVLIEDNLIKKAGKYSSKDLPADILRIDLGGLLLLPGLIDGHDHLLGSYWPRVGDRRPYLNWLVWDNDLKSSPIYKERQQIESPDLYLLGTYRHLISGVTSVQDHIPHFVREIFARDLPIRLIKDYAMAHSITSYALKWGEGIEQEHEKALEQDIPFITHGAEGFDKETLDTVKTLQAHNALSAQTVLIHGIALSDDDINLLSRHKCSVVWCPVSNLYMFEKTAPVKKLLEKGVNVVLGTDSPMSGSINIFEEFQVAREYYQAAYGESLDERLLVEMVTTNAAKAFHRNDIGVIKEGALADLLVIDGNSRDPWSSVVEMNYANIMLVVVDGKPSFADPQLLPLFEALDTPYQKVRVAGVKKIIAGDVLSVLERVRKAVRFEKQLEFLPIEPW